MKISVNRLNQPPISCQSMIGYSISIWNRIKNILFVFFSFSDSFYDKLQGWPAWQTHARAEHSRDSKQATSQLKQQHWFKRTCWNHFRNNWIFAWFHPKHLLDNCTERFVCSCYVFSSFIAQIFNQCSKWHFFIKLLHITIIMALPRDSLTSIVNSL